MAKIDNDKLLTWYWGQLHRGKLSGAAHAHSGTAWPAYWSTLISATVETAAPTHVVMTFAAANAAVTDANFTIPGITWASSSWAGAVLTLVATTPINNSPTITFVPSGGTAVVINPYFVISVDTTKAGSAADTFILPVGAKSAADYYVTWGDATAEETFTTTGDKSHTYAAPGVYTVRVRGGVTRISFEWAGDCLKLMDIKNWGNIAWGSMQTSFANCANLTGTYTDAPNTAAVTNMGHLFYNCSAFNGLVPFNTALVTNMTGMFQGCTVFNQAVAFNTIKAANMSSMFQGCVAFNREVDFDGSAVITTASMFYQCSSLNQPISISGAINADMANMFYQCSVFNSAVTLNTVSVTTMLGMFQYCTAFNQTVAFDTGAVTTMANMFYGCTVFNQAVAFDTAAVTTMANMFYGCAAFNQDVSGFDVELVTTMAGMFEGANILSTPNYNALLVSWGAQAVQNSVTLHAGDAVYTEGGAEEAGRAHLVLAVGSGGHGWTITDGGKAFNNGKLVLTFDDGTDSQYSLAYPELVAQGEAATFYIISDLVGTASHVTWANLQAMDTGGMDIQCHTKDHSQLTTLTQAQVLAEFQGVDDAFSTNSLPAPRHTSYPGGFQDANVQTWTATMRDTGRRTSGPPPGNTPFDYTRRSTIKTNILAKEINNTTGLSSVQDYIDSALLNHVAVVLYAHGIGGTNVSAANFTAIIDYAQSIGVDIITIDALNALMV